MRPGSPVLAVVCSDLHFSFTAPPSRSGEPDWFEAMRKPWQEVLSLSTKHECPILIAGDIFDRWSPPVELVNFVMGMFAEATQPIYAVPGQHDLPYHRYAERWRSAYGTLVAGGVLRDLPNGKPVEIVSSGSKAIGLNVRVVGFPWGHKPRANAFEPENGLTIALIHRYVWTGSYGYTGAPEDAGLRSVVKDYPGFSWLVFGDNHKGFVRHRPNESPVVINCGGFMRRTSDEEDRNPAAYLLGVDGHHQLIPTVARRPFQTAQERFERVGKTAAPKGMDEIKQFVRSLRDASSGVVDFRGAVMRYCNDEKPEQGVKDLLLQAVDQ